MSVRTSLKSCLKAFHRHHKSRPDIFIFTLPRTGSTLLAEILNTDPTVKTASESLALNRDNRSVLRKYFDREFLAERYVDISTEELEQLFGYYSDLSEGKTWNSYYWSDLFSPGHRLATSRTLFKTHRITYYFREFMDHFREDYGLYLLRHPVAHSLSRMSQGWDDYTELFAGSRNTGELIPRSAREMIEEVKESGSPLEKFVLSWCLENYIFIHQFQEEKLGANVIPVFYEDLVWEPEKSIRKLCEKLGLGYNEKMLSLVNVPSSGIVHSEGETEEQIRAGNRDYLTARWKERVDEQEREKLQHILTELGITIYEI